MINVRHTLNLFAVVAIAFLAFACGDDKKKSKGELAAEAEVYQEAENKVIAEIDKVVHDMPPPSEIPYLLMATGADFNGSIINPIDNASKYYNSADKAAMNLGAYASDIAYLSSYDKVQDALKYMETSQKLADQIGISSAFELELMERFESNLGNKDSLANLINYAMKVAEKKLEETDRLQMVALVLSGSYIEGLYLSVMVLDTYPEDLLPAASRDLILEPIVRLIIDQSKSLEDVIIMLKDLDSDPIIAEVISEFDILNVLYKQDLANVHQRIADQDPTLKLNKALLVDIIKEVKRIRSEMVE
ncbi:hypothetical protein N6H18_11995 [Reichenbachiella agarivorans]|uniref:Imelysin n=1 Tax=Reichenbachiella agarivorans TaxID=2979464 RepID=A0ABY6CKM0_9BACT|nr:hypothetical protein [Reichenbachiella agarivorans]UXP31072.1 hypothetical protein N6H18_11995 [Reichenbachiella agarivorans]